jgi:glycosyltransferase involved in cell wall biosynthesis
VSRVLIVANDVVAARMAGPGIRCLELARQLQAAGHGVTVAGITASDLSVPGIEITPPLSADAMHAVATAHDVILVQGFALVRYPNLRDVGRPLIVDLYDPFPLALLQQEAHRPAAERESGSKRVRAALLDLLDAGDFFICASERQRDLWIGALLAAGRVNPNTWDRDDSLRHIIDVVPFGVSESPTPVREPGYRETMVPGISQEDLLLLWGGGIYNWFDPLTLIKAVGLVSDRHPAVKLVFMSTTHPQRGVPERMWMPTKARELADSLGLTGRHVFFNQDWVAYEERGKWLAAADVGVSIHFDHAETRYAFRTRMLDYLWAHLPIICTQGDFFADLVAEHGLGWVVPPEDEAALAVAILSLADSRFRWHELRSRVGMVAASMTWSSASVPLLRYCQQPERAADSSRLLGPRKGSPYASEPFAHLVRAGLRSLREAGLVQTARKARWWWAGRSRQG